jgi:hypothetical protein
VAPLVYEYLADVEDYWGNGELMSIREFRRKIKIRWILNLYAFAFLLVILGIIFELLNTNWTILPFSLMSMFPLFSASLVLSFLFIPQSENLESKDSRYFLLIFSFLATVVSFFVMAFFLLLLLA